MTSTPENAASDFSAPDSSAPDSSAPDSSGTPPISGWLEVALYLERDAVGHLATLLSDGSPHSVPIWVGIHEGAVAFFTVADSRKDHNLQRDPRVAISLTDPANPLSMASIRGTAIQRVEGDEAWPIIDAIAQKYTGGPYGDRSPHVAFIVQPTTCWAVDYSAAG